MRTVAIWVTLVLLATPAYYWYLLPKTKRFGDWAGRTWQTLAG